MANEDIYLKISTRNEVLKGVLAGIHAFSQFELLNTVSALRCNASCDFFSLLGRVLMLKMLCGGTIHQGRVAALSRTIGVANAAYSRC